MLEASHVHPLRRSRIVALALSLAIALTAGGLVQLSSASTAATADNVVSHVAGANVIGPVAATGLSAMAPELATSVTIENIPFLYFYEDGATQSIYRVNEQSGQMALVAGNGTSSNQSFAAGDFARRSPLGPINAFAVDSLGDLFLAPRGLPEVLFVPAASCSAVCWYGFTSYHAHEAYVLAGDGATAATLPANGSSALEATLGTPSGLAVDGGGDVFIMDSSQAAVLFLPSGGCSTNCPFGLGPTTAGDIYVLAGDGTPGYGGDGGTATGAELAPGDLMPPTIALDPEDDLFIADPGNGIVRVVPTNDGSYFGMPMTAGDIYTIAGTPGSSGYLGDGSAATNALLDEPSGLAATSARNVYIADSGNDVVREVDGTTGSIATVAGTDPTNCNAQGQNCAPSVGIGGSGGPATSAYFLAPNSVALDATGALLILDPDIGQIFLVASLDCGANCNFGLNATAVGDLYPVVGSSVPSYVGDDQSAGGAELAAPNGIAASPDGDLYVADSADNVIRLIGRSDTMSTVAGGATPCGPLPSGIPATNSSLCDPTGVALDSAGDLFIADQNANAIVMVAAVNCTSDCPFGLSPTFAGDAYTIAGNGTIGDSGDGGPATAASLGLPSAIAVDGHGNVAIADTGNNVVRLVSARSDKIWTIAGTTNDCPAASDPTCGDGGPALSAELTEPRGVGFDAAGNLLIADTGDNSVRLLARHSGTDWAMSLQQGDIYLLGGTELTAGSADSSAVPAQGADLLSPVGLALDPHGNLLIADQGADVVEMLAAQTGTYYAQPVVAGDLYLVAGTGANGDGGDNGAALNATFNAPSGLAVTDTGFVLTDQSNNAVRSVAEDWSDVNNGAPPPSTTSGSSGSTGAASPQLTAPKSGPALAAVEPSSASPSDPVSAARSTMSVQVARNTTWASAILGPSFETRPTAFLLTGSLRMTITHSPNISRPWLTIALTKRHGQWSGTVRLWTGSSSRRYAEVRPVQRAGTRLLGSAVAASRSHGRLIRYVLHWSLIWAQ